FTAASSSRWAGAITRSSEDAWGLAERNLVAEARTLRVRTRRIRRRLAAPVGGRAGRTRGYVSAAERFDKQRRLQSLAARLVEVERRLSEGRVSICRGGASLARVRSHLEQARLDEAAWQARWQSRRWFITADGEADKTWGNETIRWHASEGWVEVKLPAALAHLANRPHGRYRLSVLVSFAYRGAQVAAQAASGALRYDITYDPGKDRWYLDASWKAPTEPAPFTLAELRAAPVIAVDLNAAHLAAAVVDASGNPVGAPVTIPLDLAGLAAPTRDGHLRAAISELIALAETSRATAVVVEDLDFAEARHEGREHAGRRPARGRRGRAFRRLVAGIPTSRFRDRLVQMAANRGLAVIAVDPAYTSMWGAEHWLDALHDISPDASGHHAAALVIGRRGLAQRARRRERCDSTRPEDRRERATDSAVRPTPASPGLCEQRNREPGAREARGQPHPWRKTRPADRPPPGGQVAQDRSEPPTGQDLLLLSV
ncbi:MAG: hypothetical protein M0Z40_13780, partial [Actinomycetota bacterium]|nr:hypothetical protein [Actinomycetota bacterium]